MNRLAQETSPYLLQHRDNPVDWYLWGDEAFERARALDRPVLLPVGYSSCHWCHVMAHESFEDPEVAQLINQHFVAVKVDREERPDVDAVYMEAVQSMSGSGGWPMTVFLTPEGEPFFAGTYFPKHDRPGLPSFVRVLEAVREAWEGRRAEVVAQARRLRQVVEARARLGGPPDGSGLGAALDPGLASRARQTAAAAFDPVWGGFGGAPKFPQAAVLEAFVRGLAAGDGSVDCAQVVTTSLDAMASGGIYDHLGGGFARYSTDARWLVPHFEKMLYDQASLTRLYLHAWQVLGQRRYLQVVEETVGYVLGRLRSPEGGLWSAEDADSEGGEGRYYLWSLEEVASVLGPELAPAAVDWYGLSPGGNFEGLNILHRPVRGDLLRPPEVEAARQALLAVRQARPRPGLDDKVLAEWNAQFASALAEAAQATGRGEWARAAEEVIEFVVARLRRPDGRLLRSWRQGRACHLAYAGDYAWLVDAAVRLYELTGRASWMELGRQLADQMLELFWDPEEGGLHTTGRDAQALIVRSKELLDGSSPSANSAAALALARLGALTGQPRYRQAAEQALSLVGPLLERQPLALGHWLWAAEALAGPMTEVVVAGDRPDLVEVAQRRFLPLGVLAWGQPYDSPLWSGRQPGLAYVCHNHACRQPVEDPDALAAQLGLAGRVPPTTP